MSRGERGRREMRSKRREFTERGGGKDDGRGERREGTRGEALSRGTGVYQPIRRWRGKEGKGGEQRKREAKDWRKNETMEGREGAREGKRKRREKRERV